MNFRSCDDVTSDSVTSHSREHDDPLSENHSWDTLVLQPSKWMVALRRNFTWGLTTTWGVKIGLLVMTSLPVLWCHRPENVFQILFVLASNNGCTDSRQNWRAGKLHPMLWYTTIADDVTSGYMASQGPEGLKMPFVQASEWMDRFPSTWIIGGKPTPMEWSKTIYVDVTHSYIT